MSATTATVFDHLERMSDHRGLFEHASGTVRREEHGYCTDDNARLLVVASRAPDSASALHLSHVALQFVLAAQGPDGACRNRMDRFGQWTDDPGVDDCWGRSVWGLGTAATQHCDPSIRRSAHDGFTNGARQRSPWPRAMAFAALGAAEVLIANPHDRAALALLRDALDVIGPIPPGTWSWPQARLTYANAALAEAVIAAGAALGRAADLERGLTMLAWLLRLEMTSGHLSVTPVGGRGPDDRSPRFDQQPIEVAAMADACWRAATATADPEWARGIAACAAWFEGDNDIATPVFDPGSGGGYDGLQADGVNLNQGAESTLAFISTMQRARSCAPTR